MNPNLFPDCTSEELPRNKYSIFVELSYYIL